MILSELEGLYIVEIIFELEEGLDIIVEELDEESDIGIVDNIYEEEESNIGIFELMAELEESGFGVVNLISEIEVSGMGLVDVKSEFEESGNGIFRDILVSSFEVEE